MRFTLDAGILRKESPGQRPLPAPAFLLSQEIIEVTQAQARLNFCTFSCQIVMIIGRIYEKDIRIDTANY